MPIEEVVEVARWAFNNNLGNIMLQSGELRTPQRLEYLEKMVKAVREETVKMDREKRGASAEVRVAEGKGILKVITHGQYSLGHRSRPQLIATCASFT